MGASAQRTANEFLKWSNEENHPLTNMQLQKLVFLAQGYSLAILDRPIYDQNTHAWQWGPVIPKLYKQLQKYGSGVVTEPTQTPTDDCGELDSNDGSIIHGVWKAYSGWTGAQLSALTHRPGSPWSKTWETNKFGVIPIDEIRAYYKHLLAATRH